MIENNLYHTTWNNLIKKRNVKKKSQWPNSFSSKEKIRRGMKLYKELKKVNLGAKLEVSFKEAKRLKLGNQQLELQLSDNPLLMKMMTISRKQIESIIDKIIIFK
mgnify:CR=1 FL=1